MIPGRRRRGMEIVNFGPARSRGVAPLRHAQALPNDMRWMTRSRPCRVPVLIFVGNPWEGSEYAASITTKHGVD